MIAVGTVRFKSICNRVPTIFQQKFPLKTLQQKITRHIVHRTSGVSAPLVKCKRVFQALIKLAVEELCEIADSLIAPVRLGVARPTAPFTLSSSTIEVINVSVVP